MTEAYVLMAGVRDSSGSVPAGNEILNVVFAAENDQQAIEAARNHSVDTYIGAGDFAWLTRNGKVIWSLKLEESV